MLTVSEAAALLRTFDNVLILTHIRPDGDTVGCAAALCAGLRALGRTAYLLPNPGLTDNTAPYFAPYAAPADLRRTRWSPQTSRRCLCCRKTPEPTGTGWTWP